MELIRLEYLLYGAAGTGDLCRMLCRAICVNRVEIGIKCVFYMVLQLAG